MNKKIKPHLKSQRGIAMMIALLALLLLAAIGMGLMFMADTENSVNNNYRDSQKAYFAARAGAEAVRLQLSTNGSLNATAMGLTMPTSVSGTGMVYVLNTGSGENINPTTVPGNTVTANPFLDDQLCWEKYTGLATLAAGTAGPCGSSGQTSQLMSASSAFSTMNLTAGPGVNGPDALAFKWVRIANKQNLIGPMSTSSSAQRVTPGQPDGGQVCWDGGQEVAIPAGQTCKGQLPTLMPVWELTSLAVTPGVGQNPGSRRIVQMEVAFNPPLDSPAPIATMAPVSLQGSFSINAYDNCTCSCTTTGKGANATTTCGGASCYSQAHAIYTQNTVSVIGGSGTTTTKFGSDPTVGTTTTPGASVQGVNPWPNSLNIDHLISQYAPTAQSPSWASSCTGTENLSATPATYMNCGTRTNQSFGTYPAGLPTEPAPGSFTPVTEYIPGSVKLTAAATGSGLLIVDGDLEINGGLNWYGLVLVRGKVSFTGGAGQNVNLYGSILAGEDVNATDQPIGDTFGASINFNYDRCALQNLSGSSPPQLLATHEIMY